MEYLSAGKHESRAKCPMCGRSLLPRTAQQLTRLVEIKKKYDPKNVLRLNQNIKPD